MLALLSPTDFNFRFAGQLGAISQGNRAGLKPPLNYVQTPLFLPTPLRRNTCAEEMPTKLMTVISPRFQAEDESACHEDGVNLLVPPIDDGFWAAIDNLEICRHCE